MDEFADQTALTRGERIASPTNRIARRTVFMGGGSPVGDGHYTYRGQNASAKQPGCACLCSTRLPGFELIEACDAPLPRNSDNIAYA
jgi:hypothetical protein